LKTPDKQGERVPRGAFSVQVYLASRLPNLLRSPLCTSERY
jgi:hypothetical protein